MQGHDDEGYAYSAIMITRRLLLRPAAEADRDVMRLLTAVPSVAQNLASAPCPEPGDSGESFAIVERSASAIVGGAAFGPMAARPSSIEIAWWIGQPHSGRGYATEAAQAVIDRAFEDPRVHLLWCASRASNARARRVIEKCGFQFRETGMVRSPAIGGAVPVERFVLERRNWLSLKAWGAQRQPREPRDEPRDNAA